MSHMAYCLLSDVKDGDMAGVEDTHFYTDEFVDEMRRAGYLEGVKPDLRLTPKGDGALAMLTELYSVEEIARRREQNLPLPDRYRNFTAQDASK